MMRITMPTAPITMRKLKEILRLKYGCKLSHRKIANSLSVSPSIVFSYACKSAKLGITCWPLDEQWDDLSLQRALFKTKPQLKGFSIPDWSLVQQKLRPKTMTLLLLWQEYKERHAEGFYSWRGSVTVACSGSCLVFSLCLDAIPRVFDRDFDVETSLLMWFRQV